MPSFKLLGTHGRIKLPGPLTSLLYPSYIDLYTMKYEIVSVLNFQLPLLSLLLAGSFWPDPHSIAQTGSDLTISLPLPPHSEVAPLTKFHQLVNVHK